MHALWLHRLAHAAWRRGFRWLGRFTSHVGRMLTGIEIHPGATIGRRVFIDHGMGVVIGETAEMGDDCTIYQGGHPGRHFAVPGHQAPPRPWARRGDGAGAKVLGGFEVGDGAKVGPTLQPWSSRCRRAPLRWAIRRGSSRRAEGRAEAAARPGPSRWASPPTASPATWMTRCPRRCTALVDHAMES